MLLVAFALTTLIAAVTSRVTGVDFPEIDGFTRVMVHEPGDGFIRQHPNILIPAFQRADEVFYIPATEHFTVLTEDWTIRHMFPISRLTSAHGVLDVQLTISGVHLHTIMDSKLNTNDGKPFEIQMNSRYDVRTKYATGIHLRPVVSAYSSSFAVKLETSSFIDPHYKNSKFFSLEIKLINSVYELLEFEQLSYCLDPAAKLMLAVDVSYRPKTFRDGLPNLKLIPGLVMFPEIYCAETSILTYQTRFKHLADLIGFAVPETFIPAQDFNTASLIVWWTLRLVNYISLEDWPRKLYSATRFSLYDLFDNIDDLVGGHTLFIEHYQSIKPIHRENLIERLVAYMDVLEFYHAVASRNCYNIEEIMKALQLREMALGVLDSTPDSGQEAIKLLTKALETAPRTAELIQSLLMSRAMLYFDVEDWIQCLADTSLALELFPSYGETQALRDACAHNLEPTSQIVEVIEEPRSYFDALYDFLDSHNLRVWDGGTQSGDCLFEALVDQLRSAGFYGTPNTEMDSLYWLYDKALEMRQNVVDEIENNFQVYAPALDEAYYNFEDEVTQLGVTDIARNYMENLRKPYFYADSTSIIAFTQCYGVKVIMYLMTRVHTLNVSPFEASPLGKQTGREPLYIGEDNLTVRIGYTSQPLIDSDIHHFEHYVSVYPKTDETIPELE